MENLVASVDDKIVDLNNSIVSPEKNLELKAILLNVNNEKDVEEFAKLLDSENEKVRLDKIIKEADEFLADGEFDINFANIPQIQNLKSVLTESKQATFENPIKSAKDLKAQKEKLIEAINNAKMASAIKLVRDKLKALINNESSLSAPLKERLLDKIKPQNAPGLAELANSEILLNQIINNIKEVKNTALLDQDKERLANNLIDNYSDNAKQKALINFAKSIDNNIKEAKSNLENLNIPNDVKDKLISNLSSSFDEDSLAKAKEHILSAKDLENFINDSVFIPEESRDLLMRKIS
ncbi:hypothetical protein [Mycoplasma struthionis]|uniref:Uncharacterized protein n=1 Tax=Mycoplasma struthionis TaxID=538220 RepID=A0A3G8LHU0_9MOLU|nr:hypothetical protein [Mycoplasma struthionis]AZG68432.1 hypothetical protein EGN60_00355 [Mycoplasma struthionis]